MKGNKKKKEEEEEKNGLFVLAHDTESQRLFPK